MGIKTGVEVFLRDRVNGMKGLRMGAVVHPASVLSDLRHTVDALCEAPGLRVTALFGPQHGARGEKQDNMIESEFYRDPGTGLPVHSLYSDVRRPTAEMMAGLDALLFDLQDAGTRIYTFIYTMAYCMEACAEHGVRFIVLDRPNPVNGARVEGNLLDREYRSFVGLYPIPMRHGMTVGELARMFNAEFGIGCDLEVIAMEGWSRSQWFDETGLPWVMPSPNLPTLDSAIVYPGMVLVEGTELSEGRGTTRPFELVGAPYVNGTELARRLDELRLPGVRFRAAHFEPTFQKHAGSICGGVQLHVTDREVFEPYLAGICTIAAIRSLYPSSFSWRQPPYEYEYEKLPIDILTGGTLVRQQIESGAAPDEIRGSWAEDVSRFLAAREPYLLYG